ncbi:MAG TPA: sulfatase-like hydrolase/transferase [Solirubrobacteraceae bacterium]|jgi:hypothetical protein|nr:sulfatase-like hydrolase/transferase [Solirubrobacteraceae bacterium]
MAASAQRATAPRELAVAGLHLVVLWSFAIVQPLFSDLARNGEFFVVRGNTGADVLLFAFGLVLVAPAAMLLVELAAALVGAGLVRAVHLAFVALLAAMIAIGVLKRLLPDTSAVLLPACALVAGATATAYARSSSLRSVLTVLVVAPVVFLVSFLVLSPVSQLIGSGADAAVAASLASRTPVVLVIFDELPTISLMDSPRSIDARRLPSFGRLAATSTWYRNATTVSDGTSVAVPAILTGRRPAQRLPTAREYPNSVFTLVGPNRDIHALEPVTHVCPTRLCGSRPREDADVRLGSLVSDLTVVAGHLVLPGDIAATLPPIDRDYEDFAGAEEAVTTADDADTTVGGRRIAGTDYFSDLLRGAERFVADVRPAGVRPPLYVAHFEVPHVPWRILPSGRQYPVHGTTLPGLHDQTWSKDSFVVAQGAQRHMLQVGYADRLLGRMIARLRSARLWDDALVIVTADHGVGLRPGGSRRAVTRADFAGIAGVPLFVKRPRQRRPSIADSAARTVDILPTIADVIGAKAPRDVDGRPLTKPLPAVTPSVRNGRRGRFVSMALRDFVRVRNAELARQRRLLPHSRDLFRTSLDAGPIGPSVRTLPVAGAGSARAAIDGGEDFGRVSFESGVLPVYVTGRFLGGASLGMRLAFALNGRIVAGGRTYWVGDTLRFSALLPAWRLRSGANDVTVYAMRGSMLEPVARAGG